MRRIARNIPLSRYIWQQTTGQRMLIAHRLQGSPIPPPHAIKLYWIKQYQQKFQLTTLVETGTLHGATVAAMLHQFKKINSIELDSDLYQRAQSKFEQYSHVQIWNGDSKNLLPEILPDISDRCLFWLDGHFSGAGTARGDIDTPIVEELAAIRAHDRCDHVILIDDARLFDGTSDYPHLTELRRLLMEINPGYSVKVVDDIVQVFPKK